MSPKSPVHEPKSPVHEPKSPVHEPGPSPYEFDEAGDQETEYSTADDIEPDTTDAAGLKAIALYDYQAGENTVCVLCTNITLLKTYYNNNHKS